MTTTYYCDDGDDGDESLSLEFVSSIRKKLDVVGHDGAIELGRGININNS